MKVSILYATKYGFTERCAREIAGRLRAETSLVNLDNDHKPDLLRPDVILIGGPVYGGKIRRRIPAFCDAHMNELLAKRVGIFVCCLSTGETAQALLASSFPDWLYAHAFSRGVLGGELHRGKLSAFDRLLVRGLHVAGEDISKVRDDAIQALAASVNSISGAG